MRLASLLLLCVLSAVALTGCASGFVVRPVDQKVADQIRPNPIVIGPVRNLTGRPIHAIDPSWFTSDSIALSSMLLDPASAIDLRDEFAQAIRRSLPLGGWKPAPAAQTSGEVELHAALTSWNTRGVADDGRIVVGVAMVLIRRDGSLLSEIEIEREWRLLEPIQVPGVGGVLAGEARVVDGRYRQLLDALAREALVAAGMLVRPTEQ